MAKKDVLSYSDKNYQQKKSLYDVVMQCVEDVKYGTTNAARGWNTPVEQIKGVTARLINGDLLEFTFHRYEVCTVEQLARDEMNETGKKFIKEVIKEVKKHFKKYTGKTLKLKEVKNGQAIDKASRMQADSSYTVGSFSGPGHAGRYLVKDSSLFEFSATL